MELTMFSNSSVYIIVCLFSCPGCQNPVRGFMLFFGLFSLVNKFDTFMIQTSKIMENFLTHLKLNSCPLN